ncbi:LysR substrate-binding domain-containing protein, partial [Klebsiella pneumoniae]|uniref:LysR substrate-binding domain-containing protein n=1 Tax=Klebsiella pneumoniae TaxID=573 RepID=UPI0039C0F90B
VHHIWCPLSSQEYQDLPDGAETTLTVVLSVPHFLFMLETLRNSDLVAVLPERLVRGQSGLEVVEPPLAVAGFEMLMLWHERWHRDPAHQWLRQFIVNSLEEQTC